MIKIALKLVTLLLPWPLRRRMLHLCFGYRIHETARIGWAWVFPNQLSMEAHSSIGHLTVCVHLDGVYLKSHARIGRGNWITGYPSGESKHFSHQPDRHPELVVGEHSAITNRHLIDCTSRVTIGKFSTFAGFQSQILTHSIDLECNRQSSSPVAIGEYCFVGTNCVLLGGSSLPSFSVLGAKSLLNKSYTDQHTLYAGVPAKPIQPLPAEMAYFQRETGFVD